MITDSNANKTNEPEAKQRELTFGEKLCGITFNPSKDVKVDAAKRLSAQLADLVHDDYLAINGATEHQNLIHNSALMEILNAQMNAVKFLTLKY